MTCFAQKDVTKFMGIPVDGTSSEMVRQLKSKGFKLLTNHKGTDVLEGRFNGVDVHVYISTDNGKVSRIMVSDQNYISETDIKIRFNNLCKQIMNTGKYFSLGDYTIPEDEDISYEMDINNKRYEAIFYQKTEEDIKKEPQSSTKSKDEDNLTTEELYELAMDKLKNLTDDLKNQLESMKDYYKRPVWFIISKSSYDKYNIIMFYDNEYNRPNGEDL